MFNAKLSLKRYKAGTEIPGGGGRGRLYPTLHCHYRHDSRNEDGTAMKAILMNVGVVRDKVTSKRPQTTAFEERGKSKWN